MFSFPQGTKMFQFPWLASASNMMRMAGLCPPGCPIRKPRGQGPFAPNPGLSQLTASFIASESQGIRRAPLYASHAWDTAHPRGRRPVYLSFFTSPRVRAATQRRPYPRRYALEPATKGGTRCLIDLLVFNYCHSMSQIARHCRQLRHEAEWRITDSNR